MSISSNANTGTNPGTVWLNVARSKPSNMAYHLVANDGQIGCNVGGGGYTDETSGNSRHKFKIEMGNFVTENTDGTMLVRIRYKSAIGASKYIYKMQITDTEL